MESSLLLALFIGLLIGFLVTYLIINKKNKTVDVEENNIDSFSIEEFNHKIEILQQEKDNLKSKLVENEQILNTIRENEKSLSSDLFNSEDSIKFEKEIKNLKDEIEDIEDELDDFKKRNKRLQSEKNVLEDEKYNVEKEKISLEEEKEVLTNRLEKIIKESEESKESLIFINEILNAQNVQNSDFEKLDEETWRIYYYIRNNIYPYIDNPEELEYKMWEWRNAEIKTWIRNKKKIAIVGEFSAGKTSIINRILAQDDPNAPLLPVSSKETTAIPTYISKSADFDCQFFSPENELRDIDKEIFSMVTKSVLDKVNVSHLIKYFVLSYNNKYLDNLSILDTPGFASNSDEIIKRTADVVKEADAIFWVIDANTGDINQTSIDVMQEHLHGMPLYFIINKCDTKSPNELNQLENRIRETAKTNNIDFKSILRFSQKENVEVLMKSIREIQIMEQSPLIQDILDFLQNKIKDLEIEKKMIKDELIKNNNDLIDSESKFNYTQREIINSNNTINEVLKEKKSTWFTDEKLQIKSSDINVFKKNSQKIIDLSSEIKNNVETHTRIVNDKCKIEIEQKIIKDQLDHLLEVNKGFIQIIKEYNPNLIS